MYYGKDINVDDLLYCMEKGTKDCLSDCKDFGLDFVKVGHVVAKDDEGDDDEDVLEDDDVLEDISDEANLGGHFFAGDDIDDELFGSEEDYVNTPLGTMHRLRAETFYLNGGASTIAAKSRKSRFYYNEFEHCLMENYKQGRGCFIKECDQRNLLSKDDIVTLPLFKPKNAISCPKIKGKVAFMSKNLTPMRHLCKDHADGSATVWLLCNNEYLRCRFSL